MNTQITWSRLLLMVLVPAAVVSCMRMHTSKTEKPVVVTEKSADLAQRAREIREKTPIKIAEGLKIDLWATDSLAPDPIAMSIDDQGRVYITRTNRQKNSEFDIRGHRDWMTPSIALQTVEDRRAFLKETFAPEKSEQNNWLKDLNEDGSHDWRDLAVEKDEVWRVEDTDGDGLADRAVRILNDFFEEVTDVAGALLVRAKDVFVGIAPDMWRLTDTNGDGILDKKESISHGYGIHIGFSGHGMSGAVEGPDGRIYWGIGDIGANITTKEGVNHRHPNEGVIVRSDPDGSNFEVFASGLRNTHEFVFDEYGNLISSDNDGDHPGESERLVHIVDGADVGWRSNWQYGKYTDPRNNLYKVWMDEQLFKPRWEGQAAYILPPIMNYHNGPTGMVYNPGTALGSQWKNKFFLVEFVGNPARSHIWSFGLKPKGASFELDGEKDILSGILPTGIRFGPDGALYVADWINGWGTKNYGRIWRLDVDGANNDLETQRKETQRLMQLNYAAQTDDALLGLLGYADMRIRQKAQFELVARGAKGAAILTKAAQATSPQLTRIHGIWGLGQLTRRDKSYAPALIALLADADGEIRVQAAKVLGDAAVAEAGPKLLPLLTDASPRVRFYGAQAIGRVGYTEAVPALLSLLEQNKDQDHYLRHAGVVALARLKQTEPILALKSHPNKSLRLAAVLVLRRWKHEGIRAFLQDSDEYIVAEAARAINDDESIPVALPSLAALLREPRFTAEPILRRALNAAQRVGNPEMIQWVLDFAKRPSLSEGVRAEALATVATWARPSVLDRVDGRFRGAVTREAAPIRAMVEPQLAALLNDANPEVVVAATTIISELGIQSQNARLVQLLQNHPNAKGRVAALNALSAIGYTDMESAIKTGMNDAEADVRAAALALVGSLPLSAATLAEVAKVVFGKGSVREQQQLLRVMAAQPASKTEAILDGLVARAAAKDLAPDLSLELTEAVEATKSAALIAKLKALKPAAGGIADYQEALYGGDRMAGARYFFNNSTGQCVRCHAVRNRGGEVGPSLTTIGNTLSREKLLEALVEPSARLAPGYGSVTLTLRDGQQVSGILLEEKGDELLLKTAEAEPLRVPTARVAKRENMPSSMPPMGYIMSKRELRDMVEYLTSLK